MIIIANGKTLQAPPPAGPCLILATPDERAQALAMAGISTQAEPVADRSKATRFEARMGFDYVSVLLPDFTNFDAEPSHTEVYLDENHFVLLAGDCPTIEAYEKDALAFQPEEQVPGRALYYLFSRILAGDADDLEALEDKIEALEELSTESKPVDRTKDVIALRKKLLALKRYYDALFDLLEDLEENQNGFYTRPQLRAFRLQKNRAERLRNTVANLQDYLSQVREAFQNQLDISLNQTMRVFTVITAVFLPPTLIVGWYGMNVPMPETQFPISYPIIALANVFIVAACLWVFRKKGWF